jgi:hypothetical protein
MTLFKARPLEKIESQREESAPGNGAHDEQRLGT